MFDRLPLFTLLAAIGCTPVEAPVADADMQRDVIAVNDSAPMSDAPGDTNGPDGNSGPDALDGQARSSAIVGADIAFAQRGLCVRIDVQVNARASTLPISALGASAYSDQECSVAISELDLGAGQSEGHFYVRGDTLGNASISVAGSEPAVIRVTDFVEDRHERVLVVYNRNAPDAAEIADHYARARSVPAQQVCPVELPPGTIVSIDEIREARRAVLEDCLCPLTAVRSCGPRNPRAAAESGVTQLALIRGMPKFIVSATWPEMEQARNASFGMIFATSIYRDESFLTAGDGEVDTLMQSFGTSAGRRIRPDDAMLTFSYVEAITTERTLELIDRTIAAEGLGWTGNAFQDQPGFHALVRDAMDAHNDECWDYLNTESFVPGAAENSWSPDRCRLGSTEGDLGGNVPGLLTTTVPRAINANIYNGRPFLSAQNAFTSYETVLGWRHDESICQPLCRLMGDGEADCRAHSTDFFREINTDCVGAAPGFFGNGGASYSVSYYGFYPAGWRPTQQGWFAKTAPREIAGGGYEDATFADASYVHFGVASVDAPGDATCPQDGVAADCRERIGVDMGLSPGLSALSGGGDRTYTLRFRYRVGQSDDPTLRVRFRTSDGDGNVLEDVLSPTVHLVPGTSDWQEAEATMTLPATPRLLVAFQVREFNNVRDYLDLDGVELTEDTTGTNLVSPLVGGFSGLEHLTNASGDWASVAIDRLGAVFWWGSQSHFHTGGHVANADGVLGGMLTGLSIGEALITAPARRESLQAYGDPLYRPFAARIHFDGDQLPTRASETQMPIVWRDVVAEVPPLRVTTYLGDRPFHWAVETCESHDMAYCHDRWAPVRQGRGRAQGEDLGIDWESFIDSTRSYDLAFRVRVIPDDAPSEGLSSVVTLRVSELSSDDCAADINASGYVNESDIGLFDQICGNPNADVNGDGFVNSLDVGAWRDLGDDAPDLNGDGELDEATDLIVISANFGCIVGVEEALDANDDGVADALDIAYIQARFGLCWPL